MQKVSRIIDQVFILLVKSYQKCVSHWLGCHCRFFPTCSHYAVEAIEKKGFVRGLALSFVRILKCHPFHPGGVHLVE